MAVDFETTRAAIYGRLDAGWAQANPTVLVEYQNQDVVDLDKQTAPFVTCDLVYSDGAQMGLGQTAGQRYQGAIWLAVWTRKGSGVATANAYLAALATLFGLKVFGGVNTHAVRPCQPGLQELGHRDDPGPFWFDQTS